LCLFILKILSSRDCACGFFAQLLEAYTQKILFLHRLGKLDLQENFKWDNIAINCVCLSPPTEGYCCNMCWRFPVGTGSTEQKRHTDPVMMSSFPENQVYLTKYGCLNEACNNYHGSVELCCLWPNAMEFAAGRT